MLRQRFHILIMFLVGSGVVAGSGSGGLPEKAWFHGETYLPDGKTVVSFEAETIDGEVESVTIADKSYDLRNGRLFVVSLTDGGLEVNQIDQDTRKLPPTHDDPAEIEDFLRSVPEFEKFWSDDAGGDGDSK